MADVVVDTNVISFRFKKDTRARLYRPHLVGHTAWLSFMTLAELHRWALGRRWSATRRDDMAKQLAQYAVHYADEPLCRLWAEITTVARRQGKTIQESDAWIAATALALDAPLITHNPSDFVAVSGLTVLTAVK
jgi:tRNA(fMet)-specific endonuclease VapC